MNALQRIYIARMLRLCRRPQEGPEAYFRRRERIATAMIKQHSRTDGGLYSDIDSWALADMSHVFLHSITLLLVAVVGGTLTGGKTTASEFQLRQEASVAGDLKGALTHVPLKPRL